MTDSLPSMTEDEQIVVAWLRDHDASCPVCGYDIRGQAGAKCSECGAPLRLGVVSDDAGFGAYLFAVIACACALGFDGVCVAIFGIMRTIMWFTMGSSPPPEFIIMFGSMLLLAVLSAGVLFTVVRSRVRILRLGKWQRRRVAFLIAAAVFVVHLTAGVVLTVVV